MFVARGVVWMLRAGEDLRGKRVESPAQRVPRAGQWREDRVGLRGEARREWCAGDAADVVALRPRRDVAPAVLGAGADRNEGPRLRIGARACSVDLRAIVQLGQRAGGAQAVQQVGDQVHRALSLGWRPVGHRLRKRRSRARVSPAVSDGLNRVRRPMLPRPRRVTARGSPHRLGMTAGHAGMRMVVRGAVHGGVFGACSGLTAEFVREMFAQTDAVCKWLVVRWATVDGSACGEGG